MACGRYLERALDKGLEVGLRLNEEECTGDRPSRGEGGSLRKFKAGFGSSYEGPVRGFVAAWIQRLKLFQQIREGEWVSCRACVGHH